MACDGLKPELEQVITLQSFQNWQKTAADGARHRGADGAQRLCCQELMVAGVLLYWYLQSEGKHLRHSGSHLCVHYRSAIKKLFREALVMGIVKASPTSIFVGRKYVQHADRE